MEIIIAIISSGALSTLISCLFARSQAKRKTETEAEKAQREKLDAIANGVQATLQDRIKYLCKQHIKRGKIATNDLDDLERMHRIYHDELNGNGFLDDLMEKVRQLPVVPIIPEED